MFKARVIGFYIFREILGPFIVSLLVATFVLLIAKIMELTDLVVTRGVSLNVVGELLAYTMPYFLVFTVPMATLLGVLLGFLRLSSDNEVTALKSAGVSLGQLLPPVAGIALMGWLLTQTLTIWALPWGHNQFENLIYKVAQSRADLALKERTFIDTFPDLVIFINKLPGAGHMEDVFLVDKRDPKQVHTILAKRGRLFPAKNGIITLRLTDGTMHAVTPGLRSARNASFETYDVSIEAKEFSQPRTGEKARKEMNLAELSREMEKSQPGSHRYDMADMEMQQRFAYPFSCLVMALIGLPLGTHWRSGRSWGVVAALMVFLVYYLMLSMAWSLGDTGVYPPKLGIWMPNLTFGIIGFILFRREMKEDPLPILDNIGNLPAIISSKLGLKG